MASVRDIADCLRLSVIKDLVSVSDIVTWADHVILTTDEPSSSIIDLSLSTKVNKNRITELLGDIASESGKTENSAAVIEILLAIVKKRLAQGEITYDQITFIMEMLTQNLSKIPNKYHYFYAIRDEYELSEMGYVDRLQSMKDKIDLFIKDCELPESLSLD